MHAVILDGDSLGQDADLSALRALPISLTCHPVTTADTVVQRIANADVILVNKVVLSADILRQAPRCRYIGVLATGMNNVDLEYCKTRGITVNNVAGYGTDSVAQHTLMLMLNLATSAIPTMHQVQQGEWSASPFFCLLDNPVIELANKHLVIVGYGTLGQRVAELAKAFGMRVSVAARPGTQYTDSGSSGREPLDTLLPSADVVSLHCQLSPDTAELMNAQRFALMKPGALLINTARGGLIDEHALLDALLNKHIGGAALDTLSSEPPPADHPLLTARLPNLLITPHNAWAAKEARQRLISLAAGSLAAFLQGV